MTAVTSDAGAPRKGLFARTGEDPNAIWMREMRQSARLARTPWILFTLTLSISLLMCTIGGFSAAERFGPAQIGQMLFQVFFSIAYLVVVIVGPAVAANSIASEREGRTWEAVLLAGLSPKEIARGKFLAAYTTIGLYIVALAPVGALSFLFGGVTATEVVVAFVFLFLIAGLSVAFGLAVSSLMSSLRGAIVVTLMLAIIIGPLLYVIFGFGGSVAIHKQWNDIPEGYPVWLPIAYSRAPFGIDYVLSLLAAPLLLMIVPAWFLYEATIANLTGDSDDRSSGLKRWFSLTTPVIAAACAIPSLLADSYSSESGWSIVGMGVFTLHLAFSVMLFAFEPPGPSRRVRIHWDREGAGAVRRFFGPGLAKTSLLQMLLGVAGLVGIAMVDCAFVGIGHAASYGSSSSKPVMEIATFTVYAAPFFVFLVGLIAWIRARGATPWITRVIAGGVLFLVSAGPWVVAAIAGVLAHASSEKDWLVIGAPSPFYAFAMLDSVDRSGSEPILFAGVVCATGWGILGVVLLALAGDRCRKTLAERDLAIAHADAALLAEDRARAPATSPPLRGDPSTGAVV